MRSTLVAKVSRGDLEGIPTTTRECDLTCHARAGKGIFSAVPELEEAIISVCTLHSLVCIVTCQATDGAGAALDLDLGIPAASQLL